MKTNVVASVLVGALLIGVAGDAQQTAPPRELGIRWVRDSEEYATLTRQVYRLAADAVSHGNPGSSRSWAVVLDVDETTLDNSTYQLERAAYGLGYDDQSWNAWVLRRNAPAVPGVRAFIETVRRANGHVAWITNRNVVVADATRDNLKSVGLWNDDDRLCTQKNAQDPKANRRREVVTGKGECSWAGTAMTVVAFLGDQLGDFPDAAE